MRTIFFVVYFVLKGQTGAFLISSVFVLRLLGQARSDRNTGDSFGAGLFFLLFFGHFYFFALLFFSQLGEKTF